MKRISFYLLLLAAGLTAVHSCKKEAATLGEYEGTVSEKFVNTKAGADPASILFKVDTDIDTAFTVEGMKNVRRLFNSVPGKSALEQKYGLDKWYVADVTGSLDEVGNALARESAVALVEFNTEIHADGGEVFCAPAANASTEESSFNDPYLNLQWGLINTGDKSIAAAVKAGADINVKDVWRDLTTGDPEIIIAVCDEGVKYTHPDLKANMWVNEAELNGVAGVDDDRNGYVDDIYGQSFVSEEIRWDKHAHGTHCAGIVGATNNNGTGISSVAGGGDKGAGCRIMSCQIMLNGSGAVAPAAQGIKYAADNGASIISCSFGYTAGAFSTDNEYAKAAGAELDALMYFEDEETVNNPVVKGGIAVFATGNDAAPYASYPGALCDIISVSAFGPDFLPAYYTNYGPGCNICAPGGEAGQLPWTSYKPLILSTVPSEVETQGIDPSKTSNDYGYMQGTSMACPFVSGIVGLGLSYAKKLGKTFDHKKFKEMIVTSANDIDSRLVGTKELSGKTLNLSQYRHKMGTGTIDAWLLMMKIEGVPCIVAQIGEKQWLSMDSYFGSSSSSLTYLDVEISDEGKSALGLTEDPYVKYGKLWIHPTKVGSAKIKVTAVGGGEALGGGDRPTGGMEVSQEISIVSRYVKSENGGWM